MCLLCQVCAIMLINMCGVSGMYYCVNMYVLCQVCVTVLTRVLCQVCVIVLTHMCVVLAICHCVN